MTAPANIRVNIGAPFPALVKGGGLVAVSKQNGIWTISINFGAVAQSQTVPDPANTFVPTWNALTGVVVMVPIGYVAFNKSVRTITTPGPQAAQPADDVIIIKQAIAAPFTLNVDWSKRTKSLQVVDGKGDANVNNITITPSLGQSQLASVNFSYVINSSGGNVVLTPLPDGSGAY